MEDRDFSRERVALRANAVQAVIAGEKKTHVARRYGISRQTLHAWLARHRHGGTAALNARPRGRVPRRVLEPWQEAQVAGAIMLLPPWTVDRRYTRWTKKAIAGFVERQFGVRFSEWMVDSHLKRWGFASLKDVRRAFQKGPFSSEMRNWAHQARIEGPPGTDLWNARGGENRLTP